MNTTYVSPWDEGGGVCVCARMIVRVYRREMGSLEQVWRTQKAQHV